MSDTIIEMTTRSFGCVGVTDDGGKIIGVITDGEASVRETGRVIFDTILDVASGRPSKSEALGLGDEEFVPWHIGAVM